MAHKELNTSEPRNGRIGTLIYGSLLHAYRHSDFTHKCVHKYEMNDRAAREILEDFLQGSYSKGYVDLSYDFEDLMLSVNIALSWYNMLEQNDLVIGDK